MGGGSYTLRAKEVVWGGGSYTLRAKEVWGGGQLYPESKVSKFFFQKRENTLWDTRVRRHIQK